MRANGYFLLRMALVCGTGCVTAVVSKAQFLEPPQTNLFGSDFVKPAGSGSEIPGVVGDATGNESAKMEGYENVLVFRDGRQFRGRLVRVRKHEIVWRNPDFSAPLHFRQTEVQWANLMPRNHDIPHFHGDDESQLLADKGETAQKATGSPLLATVQLGGDDWLRGDVTSADGQNFEVRLHENGTSVTTPRSQIQWMYFDWQPARGGGFDGNLANADGWLASAPSARLADDGTMEISGANEWFGRELPQPPRFEVSMEIPAATERQIHLWLQSGDAAMPNFFSTGGVDVGLGPKQLSVQCAVDQMQQKSFSIPKSGRADSAGLTRYRIFYDSDHHRTVIFRNGRNCIDWKPKEPKMDDSSQNPIPAGPGDFACEIRFRNAATGGSIAAVVFASNPFADGFSLGSVPNLLAAASGFQSVAESLIQEIASRFPKIAGIYLASGAGHGSKDERLLKIYRFRVNPWNGIVPNEEESAPGEDRLSAANLGSTPGRLEKITGKDVFFSKHAESKTPGMLVQMPRGSNMQFQTVARVDMGAAGEVSSSELEFRNGSAHIRTAFSDDLKLPPGIVNSIRFPRPAAGGSPKDDSLVFKNGDELPGAVVSAGPNASVQWRLPGGQEVAVAIKKVAGIRRSAPASKPILEGALAELRNGDRLHGTIVSFDGSQLILNEPLLGRLSLDRSQIWKLFPKSNVGIRDGACDPAGWMGAELKAARFLYNVPILSVADPQSAWLYLDGCFLPRPAPARADGMYWTFLTSPVPHQDSGLYEARAEVAGIGGNLPEVLVCIAGKETESRPPFVIGVSIFADIGVRVINADGEKARQAPLRQKFESRSTRPNIRVFVNAILGTADVMLDGEIVARIGQQPGERLPGLDSMMQFGGFTEDGHPVVFSNLWIGPWDGELPRPETAHRASTALTNGDVSACAPSALEDGRYLLETEAGPLRLPADSVSAIAFGGELTRRHAAARLRLADGSVIHAADFKCNEREVTGRSEIFGEFRLPSESVSEIIFDPAPIREPVGPMPKTPARAASASGNTAPVKPNESQ